jgi:6-phosphogluconolactonase
VRLVTAPDPASLAHRAAAEIAAMLREAVTTRGLATLAVSGGATPARLLGVLAGIDLPWPRVHVFQVDERVAPAEHPDRNLGLVRSTLVAAGVLPPDQLHPMPVEAAALSQAADAYAATLADIVGQPPSLDVVQLGLGADGHTASLFPGAPELDVTDRDVAVTDPQGGRRRMTLTLPVLTRARQVVWVVQGIDKRPMVARLLARDPSIPATRVPAARAVLCVDDDAFPAPQRGRSLDGHQESPG